VISRFQTILFCILLAASIAMGAVLWHLRDRAHQRLLVGQDSAPTSAPTVAPAEQATLLVASDADSSMLAQVQSLPLPQDQGARARAILGKLLDLYAAPNATHPVPGGAASVEQVFLMPALADSQSPVAGPRPDDASGESKRNPHGRADSKAAQNQPDQTQLAATPPEATGPEMAVVNLTSAFAAGHPSGIETETLTLLSICGTLHANLPRVTQVRFLVDGRSRPTLAGHADLTRTYLAAEADITGGQHP
jgi:hypothetical protein